MIIVALAAQVLALTSGACIDGTRVRCSLSGCTSAYKYCEYPGFGPCECYDVPTTQTATVDGKYAIVGVWYAAPGPGSSTVYSSQSVTGTTVTSATENSSQTSVLVSNGVDFGSLASASVSLTFGQEWSSTSTTSIDSKLTYTTDNTMRGPGIDGLDHNRDQIVLLLKPEIKFVGRLLHGSLIDVKWSIDASRGILYPVEVGWLNGMTSMPPNVAADLAYYGAITPADYQQLLGANPYAFDPAGLAQPALENYECVEQLYYIPGLPNLVGYAVSNSYTSAYTTSTSHTYSVALALSGTFLNQKLNQSNTWKWKNSSSTSNSTGDISSQRLNLFQPSAGYTGPTVLYVYVDKVYKTLMYSFVAPATPNAYCW